DLVQCYGTVIDVPHVERELFVPRQRVPAVDLRPSGHAGPEVMPARLLGGVPAEILHQQGSGSDETHLSANDVPELGQLVKARRAKETAERRQALFIGLARLTRPWLAHRSK